MQHILPILQLVFTAILSSYILQSLNLWIQDEFNHRIHNDILAITFEVLNQVMNDHYNLKMGHHYQPHYQYNQLRIEGDRDYCMKSDSYKYFHPDSILKDLYVVRERAAEIPKKIIKEHTYDLIPPLTRYRQYQGSRTNRYDWPIKTAQIFMHYEHLHSEYKTGEEILCLFQKYNHIPGKFSISHKNNLMDNYHRQIDLMVKNNQSQECIHNASFIPKTYRLYKKDECVSFFQYVQTQEYEQQYNKSGPQFITKAGQEVHRGRGITVIFKDELINLLQSYDYGKLCGNKQDILIAQKYISNPFLYKNHKIEFRIYFTITSTDPLIVHAYKKALIKRCAKPFDPFSTEKASHVCNTAIVKQVKSQDEGDENDENDETDEVDEGNLDNIEEEEFFIDWYLEALSELIYSEGKTNNTNWLEDELYPEIYKRIIYIVKSGEYKFYRDSRIAEFFAVDFILTDNLQIYVLEVNYNPQILSVTPERIKRNYKMILDTLDIYQAYTKSRYIRVKKFIKQLLSHAAYLTRKHTGTKKQMIYTKNARTYLTMAMNEDKFKKEFILAMKEKLELNIQPKKDNLYEKVIDENLKGPQAYHNLVQQKCISQNVKKNEN